MFPKRFTLAAAAILATLALLIALGRGAPVRAAVFDAVIYRETFNLGSYGANPGPRQNALDEGWRGYYNGMTVDTDPVTDNTRLQIFGSGSPNVQPAVNSNPFNSQEGNAFWSPLESRVVLYTEEYSFAAADLYQITYETNHNNSDNPQEDLPILKIDGKWYAPDCAYVHTDPDNNSGTYTTATFNVRDITWQELPIDTALNQASTAGVSCYDVGGINGALPDGLAYGSLGSAVTAFGVFLPDTRSVNVIDPNPGGSNQAPRERFDNYTLIARQEYADIYVSTTTAGTTGDGLSFGPHDVLQWDGQAWSKWFDGSAAGLVPNGRAVHNINALWLPDPGASDEALMSFTQNARFVPGVSGKVDGTDIVRWDGSGFSLFFDGQDVGLTVLTSEKIDALHALDPGLAPPAVVAAAGVCNDYLLISTQGPGRVQNYDGTPLRFGGEDVLGFCLINGGADTTGKWHLFLDGSAEGMPRNSTDSISASADGQTLYLTTKGTFIVDSAAGGHSMVYVYDVATGQFSGPVWRAVDVGLNRKVDALHVVGPLD